MPVTERKERLHTERKERLRTLLSGAGSPLHFSDHQIARTDVLCRRICRLTCRRRATAGSARHSF